MPPHLGEGVFFPESSLEVRRALRPNSTSMKGHSGIEPLLYCEAMFARFALIKLGPACSLLPLYSAFAAIEAYGTPSHGDRFMSANEDARSCFRADLALCNRTFTAFSSLGGRVPMPVRPSNPSL